MEVGSSIDGIVGEDIEGIDCDLNKDQNEPVEPKVGMEFDSVDDLHGFFKSYARLKGFGIRKRSSTKDEDGVSKYVRLVCSCEGNRESKNSNPLKPRPMSRIGCKVVVVARFELDGKWMIINVCLDHNHDISPSKSRLFRCNREISHRVKRQLALNDQSGIDVPKNFRS
ncbi:FAR1 DNA binding domain [Macleaya cordata]|uniref:FAR1 DNA binding domain n=1 Tax=Macleaya cordata TaxID=56857 RepID=A0A200Q7C0_MACCD|nr:FAR1 DNA binding domain [Macleaya cordata]